MPGLLRTSSSSSQDSFEYSRGSSHKASIREDYPALSFPGYAEKPLDEQLEPIAVVGMGELNRVVGHKFKADECQGAACQEMLVRPQISGT